LDSAHHPALLPREERKPGDSIFRPELLVDLNNTAQGTNATFDFVLDADNGKLNIYTG